MPGNPWQMALLVWPQKFGYNERKPRKIEENPRVGRKPLLLLFPFLPERVGDDMHQEKGVWPLLPLGNWFCLTAGTLNNNPFSCQTRPHGM